MNNHKYSLLLKVVDNGIQKFIALKGNGSNSILPSILPIHRQIIKHLPHPTFYSVVIAAF